MPESSDRRTIQGAAKRHSILLPYSDITDDGCEVVRDGSFLAVACADEFAAVKASERLFETSDWDLGDGSGAAGRI